MNVSRRTAMAGAAGGAAFGILHWHGADAAEFTFKLGHDQGASRPLNVRAVEAATKITNESGGRLAVRVYPNNQLGTDTEMIAQVRSGALELLLVGDNILGQVVPAANVPTIPFVFSNFQQVWTAMDGPLGKYIHGQIEKLRLTVFDTDWEGGFSEIFTVSRAVRTVADVKGMKLRVPEGPIAVAMFEALGASPTPLDSSEVYSALQTHLIDGGQTGLGAIEVSKFYEVAKFISLTNHLVVPFPLVANAAALQRLPKELQEILMRNLNAAGTLQRNDMLTSAEQEQKTMEGQGVTFVTPDRESFKTVIRKAGLYARWRDTYGAEPFGMLEKTVGNLS